MSEAVATEAVAQVPASAPAKKDLRVEYFREFDFEKHDSSLESLLKAGVHFGHLKSRRHPKMDPFIFTTRKNISILNLEKTVECLDAAVKFLEGVRRAGKPILFVGIKKQTHDAVRSLAERLGESYVVDRWLGGTLTNWNAIRSRARYLVDQAQKMEAGDFKKYTKLERLKIAEELEKLERKVGGLKGMHELPGAIVIADAKEAALVVSEATKTGTPIVAITDTNADPGSIDYPIPGNDDALSSLRIILASLGKALLAVKKAEKPAEKH